MSPLAWAALGAAALLIAVAFALGHGQRDSLWHRWFGSRRSRGPRDPLDTIAHWPPQPTRVMTGEEREAYATLQKALPDHLVLAQVPLSRFLRVPTRHSYGEWLTRVGHLSADLLVCDRVSQVVAVVEIRPRRSSLRSRERHDRLLRVLRAAGVRVLVWNEGELPSSSSVRDAVLPRAQATANARAGTASRPSPLTAIPVAEVDEATTVPDAEATAVLREPPPSTWFDDFDPQPAAHSISMRR
jgi:hypothetical protein